MDNKIFFSFSPNFGKFNDSNIVEGLSFVFVIS